MATQVQTSVTVDLVSFRHTFTCSGWDQRQVSRCTLRFLDRDSLSTVLSSAGLTIVQQFGDWEHQPLTETSSEIISSAKQV